MSVINPVKLYWLTNVYIYSYLRNNCIVFEEFVCQSGNWLWQIEFYLATHNGANIMDWISRIQYGSWFTLEPLVTTWQLWIRRQILLANEKIGPMKIALYWNFTWLWKNSCKSFLCSCALIISIIFL
jgi:hypothetical protein